MAQVTTMLAFLVGSGSWVQISRNGTQVICYNWSFLRFSKWTMRHLSERNNLQERQKLFDVSNYLDLLSKWGCYMTCRGYKYFC